MARTYRCRGCDTEYRGHAEYCNVCGGTEFDEIGSTPAPTSPPLKSDDTVLVVQGFIWCAGLLGWAGTRGFRDPVEAAWAWVVTAFFGGVAALVTGHVRAAVAFAIAGAVLFGLGALVVAL